MSTQSQSLAEKAKSKKARIYADLVQSFDSPQLKRLFGTKRIPWGLSSSARKIEEDGGENMSMDGDQPKFMLDEEKKKHEVTRRVESSKCLGQMTNVREQIK